MRKDILEGVELALGFIFGIVGIAGIINILTNPIVLSDFKSWLVLAAFAFFLGLSFSILRKFFKD